MEKSEFEVLLSCMYQTDFSIAYKSKIQSDLLIINQTDSNNYQEICVDGHLWRMISTTERGLSKSRNMALRNARGKICLLSDDDQVFEDNYESVILDAFRSVREATIIAFNINRKNDTTITKYYTIKEIKEANKERCFQSSMIAMRLENILNHSIWFNENIGSGTNWGAGEETLFQIDVRKKGMKIFEYPALISTMDCSNGSQWFNGYDEQYFYNSGAFRQLSTSNVFKREMRNLYLVFIKLRRDKTIPAIDKLKWIHRGQKGWKKKVSYAEYIRKNNLKKAVKERVEK